MSATDLRVVPITLAEANAYIQHVHRHNGALPSARLAVALIEGGGRVRGVAVAGIPKARMLMDRGTMEINRVGTDGIRNGCSMLYAAITRACRALGYARLITYTLASEPGTSLKASGWRIAGEYGGGSWVGRNANRGVTDYRDRHNTGPKVRWEIELSDSIPPQLDWPDYDDTPDQASILDLLGDAPTLRCE